MKKVTKEENRIRVDEKATLPMNSFLINRGKLLLFIDLWPSFRWFFTIFHQSFFTELKATTSNGWRAWVEWLGNIKHMICLIFRILIIFKLMCDVYPSMIRRSGRFKWAVDGINKCSSQYLYSGISIQSWKI